MGKNGGAAAVFEAVEKLCFSNSLSIEITLSIESAAVCARLSGTLASGLYKNRDTRSRFLWKLRVAAISYLMRAAARGTFSTS
ncbi:MAG TPA: hypothetical protein H9936_10100 [Candidatus Agathobaculum intestinigallinarum]|nr:hypothetical protein [Candidatus Agathobaculum intestinigallinarum]